MNYIVWGYIFVPIVLVLLFKNYRPTNWIWLVLLFVGFFMGIAPYIAIGYLISYFLIEKTEEKHENNKGTVTRYYPDGSYIMYRPDDTPANDSTGKLLFRIFGGLMAGVLLCVGLYIVGIMLFVTVSCGGNSKCM